LQATVYNPAGKSFTYAFTENCPKGPYDCRVYIDGLNYFGKHEPGGSNPTPDLFDHMVPCVNWMMLWN
jgi:hypothetical protein